MATYRFLRWDVTKRKSAASSMQVAEFEVRIGAFTVSWPVGTTITAPYSGSPTVEPSANLIDGTNNKFLDFGFRHKSVVIFDFGSMANAPTFDAYRYRTGSARVESDPVSWLLEGSYNGTDYTLLDSKTLHDPIPTGRNALTADFALVNPSRFRYLRWTMTHLRQLGPHSFSAFVDRFTVNEFQILSGGSAVGWPVGTVVTNPGGSNPAGEGPDKLIDGLTSTQWADINAQTAGNALTDGHSRMVIDCGVGQDVTFTRYRYLTANDTESRDPVSWELYGSNDGTSWDLLDTRSDETITSSRLTYTSVYDIGQVAASLTARFPRRTGNMLADPGFANGVDGWAGSNAQRFTGRWTGFLFQGSNSLALHNADSPITALFRSARMAVTPGDSYEATAWMMRPISHVGGSVKLAFNWYSGGSLVGTTQGISNALVANIWELIRVSGPAPAGANEVEIELAHASPATGDTVYLAKPHLSLAAVTTTFTGGSPTDGTLHVVGPSAEGSFTADIPTISTLHVVGPTAQASFTAEHEGALLDAIGPAAQASFTGETTAPNEGVLDVVGPSAVASLTGDPAHPDLRIQPVDVRPRRGRLHSRAFPVRWQDPVA